MIRGKAELFFTFMAGMALMGLLFTIILFATGLWPGLYGLS